MEGTGISLGPGEEAPRARNAEGVAGCDLRGAGPRGRHCPLRGWPAAWAGAGPPRPRHWERALRGGAQAGNGSRLGRGLRASAAAPSRPVTACIRLRSCETCRALRPSPFRGWEVAVRRSSAPRGRPSPWSNPPARFWQARAHLRAPALSFRSPLRPAVTAAASGSVPRRSARGRTRHVAAAVRAVASPKR